MSFVELPNLARLRIRAALSQGELAEQAGLRRATINLIERRKTRARMSTVRKLARVLHVEPFELMGD